MPARILVIEDNANNLELMAFLLDAFGHTALVARDGEEGLAVARREAADLDVVLVDLQLPKLDGYELLRRLRADPGWKAPLIAVTALAMVGDREKVLGAGFDGYLTKPIEPETFVADVERVLGEAPTSAPRAVEPAPAPSPPPPPTGPPTPVRATILVIDDSPDNLTFIRATLEPFGYRLITTASVEDALRDAQARPPDLILSDIHMPGKSGLDFIRAVKAVPALRPIPFVFISASDWSRRHVTDALALGAVTFILRPIEPEALLARIADCLAPARRV